MPQKAHRDPRTKEDFLNRMFSFDFSGDIRQLGERTATLERTSANKALVTFPASDTTFELVIRKPRAFAKTAKTGKRTKGAATVMEPERETEAPGAQQAPASPSRKRSPRPPRARA